MWKPGGSRGPGPGELRTAEQGGSLGSWGQREAQELERSVSGLQRCPRAWAFPEGNEELNEGCKQEIRLVT